MISAAFQHGSEEAPAVWPRAANHSSQPPQCLLICLPNLSLNSCAKNQSIQQRLLILGLTPLFLSQHEGCSLIVYTQGSSSALYAPVMHAHTCPCGWFISPNFSQKLSHLNYLEGEFRQLMEEKDAARRYPLQVLLFPEICRTAN